MLSSELKEPMQGSANASEDEEISSKKAPLRQDDDGSNVTNQASPLLTISGGTPLPRWRLAFIYSSLCLALLLSIMDLTIVATALYTIALDFGSLAESYWIILAYSLAELGFTVITSHASDFLGRRATLLASFTLFFAFSLGAGFAKSLPQLIVFRAFQGLGASGLYSLSILIMVEVSTSKTIPFVGGMIGAVVAFSGVLGPVVGGLLTLYVSWRWIFWITAPVSLFGMVCFGLALPRGFYSKKQKSRSVQAFDSFGSILLLAASVLLVFGLQQGGVGAFAWNSAVVVATLTVGCVCWVALFAWEWKLHQKNMKNVAPILPLSILARRILAASILPTLLSGFTFLAVLFLLPLRLQIVNRENPATAGLHMLPLLFATGVGSFIAGGLSRKLNNTSFTLIGGTALVLLGTGLFTTLSSSTSISHTFYGFEVLFGFGVGMVFASVSVLVSTRVESRYQSAIQGIVSQSRLFGGSIGIAAANGITNRQAHSMLKNILSPEQIFSLQFSPNILRSLNATQKEAVRVMYATAWKETLLVCTYIGVAAFVVSLCALKGNIFKLKRMKTAAQEKSG